MPAKPTPTIETVDSYPAKDFFVSMLTRDIDLQDAILDLLDNCVDGAIRSASKADSDPDRDSLKGYWAEITFDEGNFRLEDNCGGIPWDLARDYAFRMGRPEHVQTPAGMIGLVGIGMKRAIFKIGRNCFVHSNHADLSFLVTIPPAWFRNDRLWTFPAQLEKSPIRQHGTLIEISNLEAGARLAFKRGSSFAASFPDMVAESYSYLIEKGFTVKINGKTVKRRPVKICFENPELPRQKGKLIRPYILRGRLQQVDVFLTVGYRSRLRTAEEQDDDADETFAAKDAGWTIVCNDRVVLSNDRTLKTGWGIGGVPEFHNQFSCIAGIVDFRASDTARLPVTTTKRGIDASKDLYTLIRQRMQEGLKQFTRNTNRWKGYEHEMKDRFDEIDVLELRALKQLAPKLHFVRLAGDGALQQYKPTLPEKVKIVTTRRIKFDKEQTQIATVSQHLFDEQRDPNEVGETCFDRLLGEATE